MEHTTAILDEALKLLNDTLAEFRDGDMSKFDTGALSDNIEILFADDINDQFLVDIYLIGDEYHADQIAGLICDSYNDLDEIEIPYYKVIYLAQ